MLKQSQRASKIIESPIRKYLPIVAEAEVRGIKIFRLNVGDPDIAPSEIYYKELKSYPEGALNYAPSTGNPRHVEAWQKYFELFGATIDKKNIIPTVGCAEAIVFCLLAMADSGDEIIIFEPLYTSYKGFAVELGITLVPVTLNIKNNFALPSNEEIEQKISPKTKAIILIHPNNPTGLVISLDEQKRITELAVKNNLYIISDETYREIIFTGEPSTMLAIKEGRENIVVVDSASKRFSVPGARIGCVASHNTDIVKAILRMAMLRLAAPTIEQFALIPLLQNSRSYTDDLREEYKKRRDTAVSALETIPGVTFSVPDGAFYMMVSLPIEDSDDFVRFLITDFSENNQSVLVTPAKDFYITPNMGTNQVRIAFVLNVADTKRALELLKKGLEKYNIIYKLI